MRILGILASLALIVLMLVEGFETILQPRRVTHRFRYARLFYRSIWWLWRGGALRLAPGKGRETFLSIFAPLSLLGLFGSWVMGLIIGFGLLHWSLGTPLHPAQPGAGLEEYLYLSGTTFFTLGYGDMTPAAPLGRMLAVIESGLGFGFLAMIIGYLPVLYQAFSRRETMISLMDARAGSPPSAAQLLLRLARAGKLAAVDRFLVEWELWAAELLESHLSFPVLSYYRSQHDNQSWLAALTMIMDTCALLIAKVPGDSYQAQLTFAMARHAATDLTLVLKIPPVMSGPERLSCGQRQRLTQLLSNAGVALRQGAQSDATLAELRAMYEPFVNGLSQRLLFTVPPILPDQEIADNWQRSPGMPRTPGIGSLPAATGNEDHFQ